MSQIVNGAVAWFEKGLQIGKLKPAALRAKKALDEAFQCYGAGLFVMFVVMNLVFFLRTGQYLNKGEVESLSVVSFVSFLQIVNTACLIALFVVFLRLLRVDASLRVVTIVCCCALGGMFPLYSLPIGYFLYSAIQLAVQHRDIWGKYLFAAVWQGIAVQHDLRGRIVASLFLCILVASVLFYCAQIVRLVSAMGSPSHRFRVTCSLVLAWLLDTLVVAYGISPLL